MSKYTKIGKGAAFKNRDKQEGDSKPDYSGPAFEIELGGNKYNVAVAGATGAVGTEIVQILEQRNFPIDNLFLLASYIIFTVESYTSGLCVFIDFMNCIIETKATLVSFFVTFLIDLINFPAQNKYTSK